VDRLRRFLPFLSWFPMTGQSLRADILAGIAVALVLVPQSMAYAQLAGMPAYYGLYAAFLPALVGALWGSSRQLATGPVAMVSLLTGATLAQFAAPGSGQFIALAIALALMVGVMELAMGLFRLGAIVSFLSHPVIVGFTNAAAIIIALSQLGKLLGVASSRGESFLAEVWSVAQQAGDAHGPTLLMALAALAIMIGLRRFAPAWPSVLIAVAVTTTVSWQTGFERRGEAPIDAIVDSETRLLARDHAAATGQATRLAAGLSAKSAELAALERAGDRDGQRILALRYEIEVLRLGIKDEESENRLRARALRKFVFERADAPDGARLYPAGSVPAGSETDGRRWRVARVVGDRVELIGGGEVVGAIPAGLPEPRIPALDWTVFITLLSTAFVIALVGYMEAISIAKAMATRTRQRIDPNQELIGQGLANIAGSFFQSFPVSGSFSRSAVNLASGAVTGMSSVVAGLVVLVTLLALTPLLYHLPQSVLAAVIMMAVANLVNLQAIRHIWRAQRHDGVAAIATFAATLFFAPHLDTGILAGAALAIVLFLYRTMRPRVAVLGRHADGTLRDASLHGLATSPHVVAIRFDGSLYFANVPYFEEAVLEQVARHPRARHVLIVADGVNELDASGEEVIRHLVLRLREGGIALAFAGVKHQVLEVMERTGLHDLIGTGNLHRTEDLALESIRAATAGGGLPPEEFLLGPFR
jgi:SulP family sulfate permease